MNISFFLSNLVKKKIKIDSQIVGARIKPYHFRVTTRQIQNYAASIFDENSIYFDTEKEIVAHPLFVARISWEIIEKLNQLSEVEFPDHIFDHLAHQSEYLEIHRLLKPGDELTIPGEIVAVIPHKLGVKIFLKFDYFDQQNKLVLAEYIGAILFGVKCSDQGKTSLNLPVVERVEQNSLIWETQIPIEKVAPYIYDGCSNIVYPIHTDRKFARSMGLSDIILQGTATLAMSVSAIIKRELNHDPRLIKIISAKFTDVVVPPNRLSVRLLERNQQEAYFDVTERGGKFVLKGGYIKFL